MEASLIHESRCSILASTQSVYSVVVLKFCLALLIMSWASWNSWDSNKGKGYGGDAAWWAGGDGGWKGKKGKDKKGKGKGKGGKGNRAPADEWEES